jgi:hypothetical protein
MFIIFLAVDLPKAPIGSFSEVRKVVGAAPHYESLFDLPPAYSSGQAPYETGFGN